MTDDSPTFGERLYSELRKLTGYDVITRMMDYKAIQELKVSDRHDTMKLFHGSSYEVIQLLKTAEPEEVAQYFVAKAREPQQDDASLEAAILLLISTM